MKPPPNSPPQPTPDPNSDPRGVSFDISVLDSGNASKSKWSPAWIALAAVLGVFALFLWAFSLGAHSQRPLPLGPVKSSNPSPAPATVRVDIDGAVQHPGVYALSTDARVSDALTAAGGTLPDADASSLNLAAFVQDGAKISVPLRTVPTTSAAAIVAPPLPMPSTSAFAPPTSGVASPSNPAFGTSSQLPAPAQNLSPAMATRTATALELRANPLDLNTATSEQLQRLPGVGPATAQKILDYRTQNGRFNSVADLDNVKGIGQKRMDEFKDMLVVR